MNFVCEHGLIDHCRDAATFCSKCHLSTQDHWFVAYHNDNSCHYGDVIIEQSGGEEMIPETGADQSIASPFEQSDGKLSEQHLRAIKNAVREVIIERDEAILKAVQPSVLER